MMGGRLLWVGKENRRDPEAVLCERYFTRIQPYMKMDQKVIKGLNGQPEDVRQKEGDKICATLDSKDFLVLCDERGQLVSSPELGKKMSRWRQDVRGRLVWVIGGSMGASDALRQRANFMLSLSKMTMPHALARVVLLEQIYRALTIEAGHPYHHEG